MRQSELGDTQAFVHAASSTSTDASPAGTSGLEPSFVGHWQVHVDGQSESAVHGGVVCWMHDLTRTSVQVDPASHIDGNWNGQLPSVGQGGNGGLGTSSQGIVIVVA